MRSVRLALLALACCAAATLVAAQPPQGPPVSWSTLTAPQLGALDPASQIAYALAADLAAIPDAACAGWTETLMAAVGVNGAEPDDPWEDVNRQCSGFTPACLQNIPAPAFNGMLISCVQRLTTAQLAVLTAAQFSAIDPSSLRTFTQAQLSGLPPALCGAITAEQIGMFGDVNNPDKSVTCAGFTIPCVAHLTLSALGGLHICLEYWSNDVLSSLTPPQISALTDIELGNLNKEQTAAFSPAQCVELKVGNIGYAIEDATGGLSVACWTSISPSNYAGVGSNSVYWAQPHSFDHISGAQFEQFDSGAVHALGANLATLSLDACSVFTATQTDGLKGCDSMAVECIRRIPAPAWSGFDFLAYCPQSMPAASWHVLDANQVGNITKWGFHPVGADHMAELHSGNCGQIRTLQMSFWETGCNGLKASCLSVIPPASFAGLGSDDEGGNGADCIASIPTNAIRDGLTLAQIGYFRPEALVGFTVPQFHGLYTKYGQGLFDALSADQGNSLAADMVATIALAVSEGLVGLYETPWTASTAFGSKSQLSLLTCPASCVNGLFSSRATANALPAGSWGGLRADHVPLISPTQLAYVANSVTSVDSWGSWTAAALSALSPAQVVVIPSNEFAALKPAALNGLNSAAAGAVTKEQLENLPYGALDSLACSVYVHFTPSQVSVVEDIDSAAAADLLDRCGPASGPSPASPPVGPPTPPPGASGMPWPSLYPSSSSGGSDPNPTPGGDSSSGGAGPGPDPANGGGGNGGGGSGGNGGSPKHGISSGGVAAIVIVLLLLLAAAAFFVHRRWKRALYSSSEYSNPPVEAYAVTGPSLHTPYAPLLDVQTR